MKVFQALKNILAYYHFEYAEFLTGAQTVGVGLWLISPFWNVSADRQALAQLNSVIDLWLLGAVALGLGTAQLYALGKGRQQMRRVMSLHVCLLFSFLSLYHLYFNAGNIETPFMVTVAVVEALVYLRLSFVEGVRASA